MDFTLDQRHQALVKLYREFSLKEVKPLAKEIDETQEFPYSTLSKMKDMNMLGINIPKEYGGSGADTLAYILAVEELSKVCGTTGVILSAHTSLACDPLLQYGTSEQKEKYLKPLAKGEKLGAFGLTEPNAGTDAGSQQSIAVEKEDHFLLNGTKIFITNAGAADIFIIFALTSPELKTRGISCFILEKDMEGFTIGKPEEKLGIRASSTCELIFENVKIPKANLLGKVGDGFKIAMHTLDGGRIGIAAQALGIAEGAIEETIAYIKSRKQFGKPISAYQNTQFKIAELQTKVEAAKLLVYRAALVKDTQRNYSIEAAMAKLFASKVAMETTVECLQLFGGYGYTKDYPIERMMRDAKITEIYEGTSEVQKMVIGGSLLR